MFIQISIFYNFDLKYYIYIINNLINYNISRVLIQLILDNLGQ